MSLIRRAVEATRVRGITGSGDPWAIPTNGSLSTFSSAGVPVDESSIMSLLVVTACVRLISDAVSTLPLNAIVRKNRLKETVTPAPLVVSDPFGGANTFNGYGISRMDGFGQVMVSLLLRGNAYLNIAARDPNGYPTLLQILSPDAVGIDVNKKTGQRLYTVNRLPFPAENMVHIKGLTLPGQPMGLSVLSYAKRTIGLGIAAEEFGSMFFGSGAHLSGIVEVPGDLKPGDARGIKEAFEGAHSGMRHAHAVGVLSGGASFKPVSMTPEEAQFIATRAFQAAEIAMLFGVPPHMLGQTDRTTSWGKGLEEQTLGFLKFTLMAWTKRIEDAFSAMLAEPIEARFDMDELERPDTSVRFQSYLLARTAGILTSNEIRAKENQPPIEGGDDVFAALNSAHGAMPGDATLDPVTGQPAPMPPQPEANTPEKGA